MWLFRADVDRSWLCAVGVARRGLSAGWLALSLVVAAAMVPTAAAADDVDIAVDAFAAGGAVLGASPGPEVKDLVKAIVRCAIAKTPIQVCARGEVIKRLPEELQNLATCTAKEGAIEKCAAGEALSRMPPQARDLISCVGTQPNLGQCASRGVVNAASKSAMEMVDKLQADGRSELGAAAPGQIRNIINVAEGIRDDDWPKVSLYGGAEIYKLVAKTVLRIVIPAGSALAPVIDPVVDAMVQSRVDLVVGLIEAVKKGDEPKISSLIVEFYLIAHVEIPCALFNVIPGGSARDAIKDAICGTIGDAIKVIGGLSSDVTRTAESVARDALGAVGIDARGILGGDCGTTASFYASRYSVCLKQSAFLNLTNTGGADAFTNSLNASCRTTFEPCSRRIGGGTSDRISDQCNPLRDQFVKQTAALAGGIRAMAASYVRAHLADLLRASPGGRLQCNQCRRHSRRLRQRAGGAIAGIEQGKLVALRGRGFATPGPLWRRMPRRGLQGRHAKSRRLSAIRRLRDWDPETCEGCQMRRDHHRWLPLGPRSQQSSAILPWRFAAGLEFRESGTCSYLRRMPPCRPSAAQYHHPGSRADRERRRIQVGWNRIRGKCARGDRHFRARRTAHIHSRPVLGQRRQDFRHVAALDRVHSTGTGHVCRPRRRQPAL